MKPKIKASYIIEQFDFSYMLTSLFLHFFVIDIITNLVIILPILSGIVGNAYISFLFPVKRVLGILAPALIIATFAIAFPKRLHKYVLDQKINQVKE